MPEVRGGGGVPRPQVAVGAGSARRGRPVLLCWSKRVWRCRQRGCPQVTFSERTEVVRPKGVLTERARAEACRRVGQDAHSVAQVAADLGVGWPTIMRAVREFGQSFLDAAWVDRAVTRLGVDETAFGAATARSHTQFVTGVVDLKPAHRRRGCSRGLKPPVSSSDLRM